MPSPPPRHLLDLFFPFLLVFPIYRFTNLSFLSSSPLHFPPLANLSGGGGALLTNHRRGGTHFNFHLVFRLIALTSLKSSFSVRRSFVILSILHFSLLLFVWVRFFFPPPYLSRSLSEDLKGSSLESTECLGFFWFFIPVTETCWSVLIQNERVGHFYLFRSDSGEPLWACKPEDWGWGVVVKKWHTIHSVCDNISFPDAKNIFISILGELGERSLAGISEEKQTNNSASVSC